MESLWYGACMKDTYIRSVIFIISFSLSVHYITCKIILNKLWHARKRGILPPKPQDWASHGIWFISIWESSCYLYFPSFVIFTYPEIVPFAPKYIILFVSNEITPTNTKEKSYQSVNQEYYIRLPHIFKWGSWEEAGCSLFMVIRGGSGRRWWLF